MDLIKVKDIAKRMKRQLIHWEKIKHTCDKECASRIHKGLSKINNEDTPIKNEQKI